VQFLREESLCRPRKIYSGNNSRINVAGGQFSTRQLKASEYRISALCHSESGACESPDGGNACGNYVAYVRCIACRRTKITYVSK